MASHLGRFAHILLLAVSVVVLAFSLALPSFAAPYAAFVMDARTGEVLHNENADTRLHPASLTKMMTLYIAFDAIRRGEISLDTKVTVSKYAASQPPSRLGLKAGQKIELRYLIRAAAIKSANDAAAAIGDALSGSPSAFAKRMNRTAKALGMKSSSFKNAHGLTEPGHLSTARDMSHLGRRLFYDFPEYYNIFSRKTADAGMAQVRNTNTRFLEAYRGADGIKTGYTVAAGFNLTASAERDGRRIIATVFGGKSTAHRNSKIAGLLDLGFKTRPGSVKERKPEPVEIPADPPAAAAEPALVASAVTRSQRPRPRPNAAHADAAAEAVLAMQDSIAGALALASGAEPAPSQAAAIAPPESVPFSVVASDSAASAPSAEHNGGSLFAATDGAPERRPQARPQPQAAEAAPVVAETQMASAEIPFEVIRPVEIRSQEGGKAAAAPEPAQVRQASARYSERQDPPAPAAAPEVVTRISTSGGRHWGVNLGRFPSRSAAEKVLMRTALAESASLRDGLRKVVERNSGYDANFVGLSQEQADLACRRLQARAQQCFIVGP